MPPPQVETAAPAQVQAVESDNVIPASISVQCKLSIGDADDPLEQEADAMASRVMRMSAPPPQQGGDGQGLSIQRKCAACEEEEEQVQRKPLASFIQKKGNSGGARASEAVTGRINSTRGGGAGMDKQTKSFMEDRFGTDFSGVRIHTGDYAVQMSNELNAQAFTVGNDIYFNSGKYDTSSDSGRHLLAHELTHTVQQGGSGENGTISPMIQKVDMPCATLLNLPDTNIISGTAAHGVIVADFNSRVAGALSISIPGASAAPQRTEGGKGSPDQIDPQIIGGLAGTGFPDLARKAGTILEIAEIKPATYMWMAEGAAQVGRYITQGNATDAQQAGWRARNGITAVAPLLPTSYTPPSTLMVGTTAIQVAWCGPGVIVYKALKPNEKHYELPEWKPSPEWDKVLYLAMAAALAAAMKKAGMKLNPALRYASIVAMIYLLGTGKAEASVGLSGDDPLEAMFKAMEQDGIKVPPEVQEMIKNDPELKKMVEESAKKGGKLSDVQKEMARKYGEFINQHINEFSKEELEAMLSTTENMSDKMPSDMKVEDIKKALRDKASQKGGTDTPKDPAAPGSGASGSGNLPGDTRTDEPAPAENLDTKFPRLSEETKKKIKEASAPVKKIWEAYLQKIRNKGDAKEGFEINDELVNKFFAIVPIDITDKQADDIVGALQKSPDATLDQVLDSLRKGVEEVKKGTAGTAAGDGGTTAEKPADGAGENRDELIKKLAERAKGTSFDVVKANVNRIIFDHDAYKQDQFNASLIGKTAGGVGYVGDVMLKVVSRNDKTFVARVISATPFVTAKGEVVAGTSLSGDKTFVIGGIK